MKAQNTLKIFFFVIALIRNIVCCMANNDASSATIKINYAKHSISSDTTYCTLLRKITAYIDRLVKKQEKSKKGKLLTH